MFAAVAALGAGLQTAVETTTHQAALVEAAAAFPVAVFLVLIGLLQTRLGHRRFWVRCTLAAIAVIGLAAAALALPLPVAIVGMGLVIAVLAALDVVAAHRRLRAARAPIDRDRRSAATPRRRRRSVRTRLTWDVRSR